MPEEPKPTPEEIEAAHVKFERASDFRSIYANYIQTAHTAFDLSVTFGETVGVPDVDGKVLVEQRARITFAPLEALVFRKMLDDLISLYQLRFGQILIPPDFAGLKKSEGV